MKFLKDIFLFILYVLNCTKEHFIEAANQEYKLDSYFMLMCILCKLILTFIVGVGLLLLVLMILLSIIIYHPIIILPIFIFICLPYIVMLLLRKEKENENKNRLCE